MSLKEMFKRKDEGKCPYCGRMVDLEEFRDELSFKEFQISGLCQNCQDNFFKEE